MGYPAATGRGTLRIGATRARNFAAPENCRFSSRSTGTCRLFFFCAPWTALQRSWGTG